MHKLEAGPQAKISLQDQVALDRALDDLTSASAQFEHFTVTVQALLTDKGGHTLLPIEVARIEWGVPIDPILITSTVAHALAGVTVPAGPNGLAYLTVTFLTPLPDDKQEEWTSCLITMDDMGMVTLRDNRTLQVIYKRE